MYLRQITQAVQGALYGRCWHFGWNFMGSLIR